jgi:hypothetical protein
VQDLAQPASQAAPGPDGGVGPADVRADARHIVDASTVNTVAGAPPHEML